MSRRAEFDIMGPGVALNIQDTGGSYVDDFPAMVELSIQSADVVILGNKEVFRYRSYLEFLEYFLNIPYNDVARQYLDTLISKI